MISTLHHSLCKHHITLTQMVALQELAEQYRTMGEMAKLCHQTAAWATRTVDRLEKLGLAQRHHCPSDRRKIIVRISQKGLDILQSINKELK